MAFDGGKLMIVSLIFALAALAVSEPEIEMAESSQCAASCYAQEQACMQKTKGSASCSAQLIRCLQSCR